MSDIEMEDYDELEDNGWETESGSAADEMDVEMEMVVDDGEAAEEETRAGEATRLVDAFIAAHRVSPTSSSVTAAAPQALSSTSVEKSTTALPRSLTPPKSPSPTSAKAEEEHDENGDGTGEEDDGPWKKFDVLPSAPVDHAFLDKRKDGAGQQSRQFMARLSKEYKLLSTSLPGEFFRNKSKN